MPKLSKRKVVCFVCGSEDVEVSKEFDHFCSEAMTTSCVCEACGASWYDDTLEG